MFLQVAVNLHIYQLLEYATPDENIEERKSSSGAAYDNTLGLVFSGCFNFVMNEFVIFNKKNIKTKED